MRYTRVKDKYECRIAGGCPADEWFENHTYEYFDDLCEDCPFEKLINKLAEYEDEAELMEDDKK